MKKKVVAAKEFDELFDNGEDVSELLDMNSAKRNNLKNKQFKKWFPFFYPHRGSKPTNG